MKTYTTKVAKNGTVLYYDAKTGKRLAKETALANERNYIINNGTVEERYKLAQEYYRGTDDGRIEKFGKHSTYISSRGRATTRTNWHRIGDIAADVELSHHYNLTVDEFKAQFAAANKTSVEEPKEETAPVAEPAAEPAVEETASVEAEIVEVKTASEMKAAYAASRNVVRVHFTAKGYTAWQSIYHYGLHDRETYYQRISKKDAAAELAKFGLTTEQVIAVEKAQDAINAEEREACKAARNEGRCYSRLDYHKVYQKALAMVFGEDEPATVEETAASLPESPNNDGDELIDAPEVKAPVDDLKEDEVMETMDEIRDMLNDAIYGDYDENSERYKALLDTLSELGISVDTDKLKDFAAAVEYYAETGTEKVLETAAETVNAGHWGYKFYPDVDTYDEVGEAVFYENTKDCRDLPDWFVNYFDCEQLGEDMERYDGGKFTRYGFFMPLG